VTGIYSATHRRFADGSPFAPDQVVGGDVALRAFTSSPAATIGLGDRLGKLAVGYLADIVLLDRDPRDGAKSLADDPLRRMWVGGTEIKLPVN
jgi:predicted amidohydrolase YtcJ